MSDENKWMEQLPPELIQILEQLLPIPYIISNYIKENKRLEAEILILGNVLVKKGLVSLKELEEMTVMVLEEKEKEARQKMKDKPELLTRKEYMEIKEAIDQILAKKKEKYGK